MKCNTVYKEICGVLDKVIFGGISYSDNTFKLAGERYGMQYHIRGREIDNDGVQVEIIVGNFETLDNIFDDYELEMLIEGVKDITQWM